MKTLKTKRIGQEGYVDIEARMNHTGDRLEVYENGQLSVIHRGAKARTEFKKLIEG